MIITNLTGDFDFLHPAYPIPVVYNNIVFPSVLHASYASMHENKNVGCEIIPMVAKWQDLFLYHLPKDKIAETNVLWQRIIDLQIQKYSKSEIHIKLMSLMEDTDYMRFIDPNTILGFYPDKAEMSMDMIGITTTLIRRYNPDSIIIMDKVLGGAINEPYKWKD